ncbi:MULTISPECIES: hypothetical protein [Streptomyces]|uniref:Lipoprotein n=1 Tax=Streptomyces virginiae TaxID=1961 RepID=A0ABZ1T5Y0_STRVG|nr:hypothetical protein [Streptomyces virginiae]WTB21366.1 hypothetical protein OG253_07625 [Streptomyces virginiae]
MMSPTKIRRVIAPALLTAAVAVLAPQCPGSSSASLLDDAGRSIGRTVRTLDVESDGTRVLTTPAHEIVIPPQADDFTADVNESISSIAAGALSDLDMNDARTVVARGCALKDGAEVLEKEELTEQARSALINFGGNPTLQYRVADLARSMATAERTEATVGQAAIFALCETA